MSKAIDIAKKLYEIIDEECFGAMDVVWSSENIKTLIKGDVLRIVSIVYIFSDSEEREVIDTNIKNIFDISHPKEDLINIIEDFNSRSLIQDVFLREPYSVRLASVISNEQEKTVKPAYYLNVINAISLAIIAPGCQMKLDMRFALLCTHIQCSRNRLSNRGIVDNSVNCDIPDILSIVSEIESPNPYVELQNEKAHKIYDKLANIIAEGTLVALIEDSKMNKSRDEVSIKAISKFIEEIDRLDVSSMIHTLIVDKLNIHFDMESEEEFEESDDFEESENEEEDRITSGHSFEELLDILNSSADGIDEYCGLKCELRFIEDGEESDVKICSTFIECLKYVNQFVDDIQDYKKFSIMYHNIYSDYDDSYNTQTFYCIEEAASEIIGDLKDYLRRKEINRANSIEFDESVLPHEYTCYSEIEVTESNFDDLWDSIKKIEKKYEIGLYQLRDETDDYQNVPINDWESECSYEQGMYLRMVKWCGEDIPVEYITFYDHVTYRRLSKEQLKYYLYWRTYFSNDCNEQAPDSYKYIYMYELLAGIYPKGTDNISILKRLVLTSWTNKDNKYGGYYSGFGNRCRNAIAQYERIYNLIDYTNLFKTDETSWTHEWDYCGKEILSKDYTHIYNVMNRHSSYHMEYGALNKKVPCAEIIKDCIRFIAPYISALYTDNGVSFEEDLVGTLSQVEMRMPDAIIWTDRVQERLYGDQRSTAFTLTKKYWSDGIAEYVIKTVENAFRVLFKVGGKLTPSIPSAYVEDNYGADNDSVSEIQCDSKKSKYIQVYNKLDSVLAVAIKEYLESGSSELEDLKQKYIKPKTSVATTTTATQIPYERKIPADDLMRDFINQSEGVEGELKHLLDLYNEASPSLKKSKANRFSCWIHDFWILNDSNLDYHELRKIVVNNKWNIEYLSELYNRDYERALPYFLSVYNPCTGVMGKKYGYGVIADAIILTFSCLSDYFSGLNVDLTESILGEFGRYEWNIYNDDENLTVSKKNSVIKNLNNIEIYSYDAETQKGIVWRHSFDENSKGFVSYIIRAIDNCFRELSGYTSFLKNDFGCEDIQGHMETRTVIDTIVAAVARFVGEYNNPRYTEELECCQVLVTNDSERTYTFAKGPLIEDLPAYIDEKIKSYYGIESVVQIAANRTYDYFEIDLDNFDINDYLYKYEERETIDQNQPSMMIYAFRNNYFEISNRLMSVNDNKVEYNSSFCFTGSKIMKKLSGLINKDLNVLAGLASDSNVFMQWVEWAKRGCFVYANNEPYVQIFFYFILNDWILPDNHLACLVMMCNIFNHYFENKENVGPASDLYLEWIKDYYILYCSQDISYDEFRSLFIYDVNFYSHNRQVKMIDHFFVNMSLYDENNLLPFYNRNCDYRVLDGSVVTSGYRELLEDSLEAVHVSLNKLWNSYGLDLVSFFNKEEISVTKKQRDIFYRAVLTLDTKRKIVANHKSIHISDNEEYGIKYDYEYSWPVFTYEIEEISNTSSRFLLEYIVKLTEKGVREWLNMPYNFKIDEGKLFEAFPNRLFEDNMSSYIIESTIMDAVLRACISSKYPCKNPKLIAAQDINDDLSNVGTENQLTQRIEHMKYAANMKKLEYDHIERGQGLDKESIEEARKVLRKNQERLVIDEDVHEEVKEEVASDKLLTSDERKLLMALLHAEAVNETLSEFESRFVSVALLIEGINNKAIELYGDIAIEGDDSPYLVDDYLDEIRQLINM